jgi:parvulin-like peptidyl-prolyl isomerase
VAFALAEGEISEVLEVEEGFVILRNAGFVAPTTMSEEEAVSRIRAALRRDNREAAWNRLRDDLLAAAGVAVFDDAIAGAGPGTPIGVVDGEPLTYGAVDALARRLGGGSQPDRQTDARIRATILAHAFTRLAAERARRLGLEPAPDTLARSLWERRSRLAEAELVRRALEAPLVIEEAEIRAHYEADPSAFAVPAEALVSVLQLRLDGDVETLRQQTERARGTRERIRRGEVDFAAAAREVSEHPSAPDGGDVGWRPRRWAAGLGPNVMAELDRLQPGEVSEVVRQDDLWILQLRDRRPARVPS